MLKEIILAENALDPETWERFEHEDVRDFLMERFDKFPDTARIYHGRVSAECDVTPHDQGSIDRLGELEGPFFVVVYPGDPVTIIVAIVAVVAIAAVVLMQPPVPTLRNTQNQSPNNELSDRSNRSRPLARIPDIFGQVRSTPDFLAVPLKAFIDHQEVEYAYMCIGRGEHDIEDVKDDTTLISEIVGSAVEVYGPYTSPNSGDEPQLRIGDPIGKPVYSVSRSNAVNGQVLRPPNSANVVGQMAFNNPNTITSTTVDFTKHFEAGDAVTVANSAVTVNSFTDYQVIFASSSGWFQFEIPTPTLPSEYQTGLQLTLTGATFTITDEDGFWIGDYDLNGTYTISNVQLINDGGTYYCRVTLTNPASINSDWNDAVETLSDSATILLNGVISTLNLDGNYTIVSVNSTTVTLDDPASVNPTWNDITTTSPGNAQLFSSSDKWIGPFVLDRKDTDKVACNFVAIQGLYKDDGENQVAFNVQVLLEVTPINNDGSPRGSVQTQTVTLIGSATSRTTRAATLEMVLNDPGLVRVRAKRVTPADLDYEGSVVDEIKWRDVYALTDVAETEFGDITTVQSITYATDGALALKERKLNMLATRRIPSRHVAEYDFGDNAQFDPYFSTSLEFDGWINCTCTGAGNFGTYVAIPEFTSGDVFTVDVDLTRFAGVSQVKVALYETGGPGTASTVVNINARGTATVTLTANRNSAGTGVAKVLFYVPSSTVGKGFALDNVRIQGPGGYDVSYGFSDNSKWIPYDDAGLNFASSDLVVNCTADGFFGAMVEIPEFKNGDQAVLQFDLDALNGIPSIKVALYETGGPGLASFNPVQSSTGTKTVTLTANRDSGGTAVAKILFYSDAGTLGDSFTLNNVNITLYSSALQGSKRADDIFIAVCQDPYIGNRSLSEIDTASVYAAIDDAREYFGHEEASQFAYTFDADNLSFEETAQSVAQATFCTAYRQGNVIKLKFNKETEDTVLLFNHRNKLPGSETRTVRFGNENNYDGIEFSYVSPEDDAILTFYIPSDRSSVNPRKVESVGVRSQLMAYFHAWREWNRVRYQNTYSEFEATQEADLLVVNDRVLVADNTRTGTQDGEVLSQNVLELELSQPVTFEAGVSYNIFLQHTNGTVESIEISPGSDNYHVILAQPPSYSLALDDNLYARTTYIIIGDNAQRGSAFLVAEKDPQSNFTSMIRTINYDARYFQNDKAYLDGLVNEEGIEF